MGFFEFCMIKKRFMKILGVIIKEYRELMKLIFCQVEDVVGIFNVYFSQFENDKIKKLFVNVFYKLFCLYCVNIEVFLYVVGIIKDELFMNSNII